MSEEHYRALGISPDASRAEIEAAYKQRVKETHPDLNDDPNAADEFQRVKEARDALLGSGAGSPASGSGGASTAGGSGGASTAGGSARGGSTGDAAGRSRSGGGSRHDTSTRTEEPTGDRTEGRGRGASGSRRRQSRGSTSRGDDGRTGSSRGETSRTDAAGAGSAGGSGRNAAGAAGAGSASGRGGADRSGREASGGTASRTRDYPRYRSVIEEPTGGRASAYHRVVPGRSTPTQQTGGRSRRSTGVASDLLSFPGVLVKQFVYSWMWGIVGVPLAVLYLYGVRGLYYGGLATTSALAMLLGAIGVSFVKVRIGIMMSGVATVGLAYYALIWHPDPSWLEVAIAFHLVPLYVITALVAEYA